MDAEGFRKKLEEDVLKIIEDKLLKQEIDPQRASQIAKYILESLHPHMPIQQIYDVSKNFESHFSELVPIVLEIQNEHEEVVKKAVQEHISELIKQDKLDDAQVLALKTMHGEIKLEK